MENCSTAMQNSSGSQENRDQGQPSDVASNNSNRSIGQTGNSDLPISNPTAASSRKSQKRKRRKIRMRQSRGEGGASNNQGQDQSNINANNSTETTDQANNPTVTTEPQSSQNSVACETDGANDQVNTVKEQTTKAGKKSSRPQRVRGGTAKPPMCYACKFRCTDAGHYQEHRNSKEHRVKIMELLTERMKKRGCADYQQQIALIELGTWCTVCECLFEGEFAPHRSIDEHRVKARLISMQMRENRWKTSGTPKMTNVESVAGASKTKVDENKGEDNSGIAMPMKPQELGEEFVQVKQVYHCTLCDDCFRQHSFSTSEHCQSLRHVQNCNRALYRYAEQMTGQRGSGKRGNPVQGPGSVYVGDLQKGKRLFSNANIELKGKAKRAKTDGATTGTSSNIATNPTFLIVMRGGEEDEEDWSNEDEEDSSYEDDENEAAIPQQQTAAAMTRRTRKYNS